MKLPQEQKKHCHYIFDNSTIFKSENCQVYNKINSTIASNSCCFFPIYGAHFQNVHIWWSKSDKTWIVSIQFSKALFSTTTCLLCLFVHLEVIKTDNSKELRTPKKGLFTQKRLGKKEVSFKLPSHLEKRVTFLEKKDFDQLHHFTLTRSSKVKLKKRPPKNKDQVGEKNEKNNKRVITPELNIRSFVSLASIFRGW